MLLSQLAARIQLTTGLLYVNFPDDKMALAFYNAMGQSIYLTGMKYSLKLPGQKVKAAPSPKLWAVCPWRVTGDTHLDFLSQFGVPTALYVSRDHGFCVRFRAPGSAMLLRDLEAKFMYLTGEGRSCSIKVLADSDPDLPDVSKYENVEDLPHPSWHAGSCVFSITGDSLAVRDMGEITGWVHKYFGAGINVTEGSSTRTVVLTFPDIGMADAFVHNYMHNDDTVYLLKGQLVKVQGHLTDEKVEPVDLVVGDWVLQEGYLEFPSWFPPMARTPADSTWIHPNIRPKDWLRDAPLQLLTPRSTEAIQNISLNTPAVFLVRDPACLLKVWSSQAGILLSPDNSRKIGVLSACGVRSRSFLPTGRGALAGKEVHGQKTQQHGGTYPIPHGETFRHGCSPPWRHCGHPSGCFCALATTQGSVGVCELFAAAQVYLARHDPHGQCT